MRKHECPRDADNTRERLKTCCAFPSAPNQNCCEQLISKLTFFDNQMYSTSSQILQRDKVKLNYLHAQNKIKPSNE